MFRGILAALGLINFGFGVLSAVQPELVAGWIGFELTGPSAVGEMRAVFGGAVTVVGVLFIVATVVPRPVTLLGGLALVFAALTAGRVASLFVDGWSFYTLAALLLEAPTAGISAYLWRNPHLLDPEPELESALEAAESESTDAPDGHDAPDAPDGHGAPAPEQSEE